MKLTAIILSMAIVTVIPRILPVFILERLVFPRWVSRWLRGIPYAVLGALIWPGVIYVEQGEPLVGLVGAGTAVLLAVKGMNIMFIVCGSILAVYLMKLWV